MKNEFQGSNIFDILMCEDLKQINYETKRIKFLKNVT